ncbi:outer membrane lipoprotein LolB [Janthinobacterium agaricidamnosum]|uniref:Outer-membrane lipoprotein LolB n=1 Tax=Janthinobacterium agaricidamnosum NBRC 102515 = DSM 9628 TaxID=1349767 RepID=W0VDY1_9BURK|nr:outer membrane lipoprotein LolB [Janthinobacterium agaricidamnosum]CDG85492.1 outer membrane lipoLolB family protein [Janthinobacterium agaricidamnosum NBRC 102515 = DSM 9628]
MTLNNFVTVSVLCALLSACATTSAPRSSTPAAPYSDAVELSGRLSVNYERDGKGESLTGKFNWRQSGARTDVSLDSPLGQTIASISVIPGQATLTQAGKAPRSAADIDTLSAQALGWSLPVSGLRDWLQGYAQDADGKRFVASPLNDSVTTRDGWRLHYVSWQDGDGAYSRPRRIDAERSATVAAGQVAIRIVLDQ